MNRLNIKRMLKNNVFFFVLKLLKYKNLIFKNAKKNLESELKNL